MTRLLIQSFPFFFHSSFGDVAGIVFLPIRSTFGEFASFLRRTLSAGMVFFGCRAVQRRRFPLPGSGHPRFQPDLRPQPLGGLSPPLMKPNKQKNILPVREDLKKRKENGRMFCFCLFCKIRRVLYKNECRYEWESKSQVRECGECS